MRLAATLVTDGASDGVLLPVIQWLVGRTTRTNVDVVWADTRLATRRPHDLAERLEWAVRNHPCNLLFVHRDAEGHEAQLRYDEILRANQYGVPHVCVAPVRMTAAWLLHDEEALRRAAGRPSGTEMLDLPPPRDWERIPDPKNVLHTALRRAHAGQGRRAKRFAPEIAVHRMASLIQDWSPLLQLQALRKLDADLRDALGRLGAPLTPRRS